MNEWKDLLLGKVSADSEEEIQGGSFGGSFRFSVSLVSRWRLNDSARMKESTDPARMKESTDPRQARDHLRLHTSADRFDQPYLNMQFNSETDLLSMHPPGHQMQPKSVNLHDKAQSSWLTSDPVSELSPAHRI